MKKSIKVLLKKADSDLKDAKILYNNNESSTEGICFHCQQAIEKYLKCYLIYNNNKIKKTHNISELLGCCKKIDKSFNNLEKLNIDDMTNYAVVIRYTDDIELDKEDAKEAILITEKVKLFIIEKFNNKENCKNKLNISSDIMPHNR